MKNMNIFQLEIKMIVVKEHALHNKLKLLNNNVIAQYILSLVLKLDKIQRKYFKNLHKSYGKNKNYKKVMQMRMKYYQLTKKLKKDVVDFILQKHFRN